MSSELRYLMICVNAQVVAAVRENGVERIMTSWSLRPLIPNEWWHANRERPLFIRHDSSQLERKFSSTVTHFGKICNEQIEKILFFVRFLCVLVFVYTLSLPLMSKRKTHFIALQSDCTDVVPKSDIFTHHFSTSIKYSTCIWINLI